MGHNISLYYENRLGTHYVLCVGHTLFNLVIRDMSLIKNGSGIGVVRAQNNVTSLNSR